MRESFCDQLVRPIDVCGRFDRTDRGDGSPAFGDGEADARSHTFQMSAQVGLEIAYADGLHK
jgi:hypothetical protein